MLPEQLAFKKRAEENMRRIEREKKSIPADSERNLRGIKAARKALKRSR